jgi:hypothetical protein
MTSAFATFGSDFTDDSSGRLERVLTLPRGRHSIHDGTGGGKRGPIRLASPTLGEPISVNLASRIRTRRERAVYLPASYLRSPAAFVSLETRRLPLRGGRR